MSLDHEPDPPLDFATIASDSIARHVRILSHEGDTVILEAPHDTTEHGLRAIVNACTKADAGGRILFTALRAPLDEPAPGA